MSPTCSTFQSIVLLAGGMDYDVAKAVCAFFVFIATHAFTRILSRLPYIGVNFFMIKMVMFSILKFLLSYAFHFVGYAVAFHILLPDTEVTIQQTSKIVQKRLPNLF